jgi:hypothetical protein
MLSTLIKSEIFDGQAGLLLRQRRTICEVHREIYDALVLEEVDKAVELLEEAFFMGRRMAKRMIEQKIYDLDHIVPEGGADFITRRLRRLERVRLQKEHDKL